jgi:hypothetical protein
MIILIPIVIPPLRAQRALFRSDFPQELHIDDYINRMGMQTDTCSVTFMADFNLMKAQYADRSVCLKKISQKFLSHKH